MTHISSIAVSLFLAETVKLVLWHNVNGDFVAHSFVCVSIGADRTQFYIFFDWLPQMKIPTVISAVPTTSINAQVFSNGNEIDRCLGTYGVSRGTKFYKP